MKRKKEQSTLFLTRTFMGEDVDVLIDIPSGFFYSKQTGKKKYTYSSDVIQDAKKIITKKTKKKRIKL